MSEQPDDRLPGIIAGVDQAMAMAPLLAKSAMGLFCAFKAEGFTDEQALRLVMSSLKSNGEGA